MRLIALDIDGTLLDSRWQLPARNRDAIAQASAQGVEIALVTGRRFDFARPIIEQLPCPITAVVSNGAVVRLPDGSTPIRHRLDRLVAHAVLMATPAHRVSAGLIFDRPRAGQVVFDAIDWTHPSRRGYAERNRDYITEVSPLESALVEDPIQVMFNGPVAEMRCLTEHLRGLPMADQYTVTLTEYVERDFTLVDVLAPGCSKGRTVREWAARQGYRREDVMAIGDNLNDVEMLEAAGRPVVMANAVAELRSRGWAQTASNDEAGVATAIHKYVLSGG